MELWTAVHVVGAFPGIIYRSTPAVSGRANAKTAVRRSAVSINASDDPPINRRIDELSRVTHVTGSVFRFARTSIILPSYM